jgi:hypothetical protein
LVLPSVLLQQVLRPLALPLELQRLALRLQELQQQVLQQQEQQLQLVR